MKHSLGLSQGMRLEQRLGIHPQMMMQMSLLALPLLDFNAEIEEQAQDNPALDVQRPTDASSPDTKKEKKDDKNNDEWDEREMQKIAELGEDPNAGQGFWGRSSQRADEEWSDPMQRVAPAKTLIQDLLEQVHLGLSDKPERIGEFLVQDLDSRGFLVRDLRELASDISAYLTQPVSEKEVSDVLEHLKETLEPPGIGASSVEESITLQLKRRRKGKWVDLIVRGYQLLAAGKERELVRLCNKHGADPSFVFHELEKLYFVPTFGTQEEAFDANSVRPEVFILREHPELPGPDKYEVQYNSNALVRLRLNAKTIELARRRSELSADERKFLRENVQRAKWLKQVVDERRSLLLRAVQVIVNRQWEFLDKGRRYLRPLTQREVANEVGREESTISRLVNGRFADTPQGCVPLSAFFSQAVGHSSGVAAREVLREIMDTEDGVSAYTDDELSEMMGRRGFAIRRRTVNKYRRMLGGYYALKRSVRRAMKRVAEAS